MSAPRQSWPKKTEDKNRIFLEALRRAWESGWRIGRGDEGEQECPDLDESVLWAFDARVSPGEEKGKRAPKAPSPKKPSGEPEELSKLPYDNTKCRARKYNKGWPLQCWKIPGEERGVCHLCADRQADDAVDFWGFYDEPLEDCCLNKDGNPHSWKPLEKSRAEKKASDREEKKKQKEEEKRLKEEEKEKKKAEKHAQAEKKKRLKDLKKKAKADKKKPEDPVGVAPPPHPDGAAAEAEKEQPKEEKKDQEEPVSPREGPTYAPESPRPNEEEELDEDTQSLDEDTQSLDEPPAVTFEEYNHDGYTMKWNKITNDLLDPDDDEVLGKMVCDDEGNWNAVINVDDSDDSDEDATSEEDEPLANHH